MEFSPGISIVNDDRHRFFLAEAYDTANRLSDDPVTKIGAVLVRPGKSGHIMIGYGANHLKDDVPRDLPELSTLLMDSKWKYEHMLHAEDTAISWTREKIGETTEGATMYMPWVPCKPCAEKINAAGIIEIIGHKQMIIQTPERWWPSTLEAVELLKKKGISIKMYDGPVGNMFSTFNWQIWMP